MMKPNILMIMADQLTPLFMGSYGHPAVKTPNLDRLAGQGVQFEAAYSPCPLCAPARAALMTGRYVSETGMYDNSTLLPADQPTVAHYLTNAGYDCALSGKMHFVGPDQLHGFKQRFVTNIYPAEFSWNRSRDWEGNSRYVPPLLAPSYISPGFGQRRWNNYLEYDERAQYYALEFLRRHRQEVPVQNDNPTSVAGINADQPFFLTASFHHPHQPFHVPRKYWEMYEGVDIPVPEIPEDMQRYWSQMDRWLHAHHGLDHFDITDPENIQAMQRAYCGLVSYVDHLTGQLLEELEEQGLADNTVVVFTSDHGDMLGARGMIQKNAFYEQSARVPLLMRFPDGRAAGTRMTEPVSLIDLMPTLTDIAGVSPEILTPHDGESLLPLIDAKPGSAPRIVFSESHADGTYAPCFMARRGQYKYIYIHGHDAQLFDLEHDPGEWRNLAGQPETAEVEAELKAAILNQFDPERIEQDIRASIDRRLIIDMAMKLNETSWAYDVVERGWNRYRRDYEPAPEAPRRALGETAANKSFADIKAQMLHPQTN